MLERPVRFRPLGRPLLTELAVSNGVGGPADLAPAAVVGVARDAVLGRHASRLGEQTKTRRRLGGCRHRVSSGRDGSTVSRGQAWV